jgi:hypothetical protein
MSFNAKKYLCLTLALLLVCALAACDSATVPEETQAPATEAPVVTEPPMVDIGGMEVAPDVTVLDLSGGVNLDALLAVADRLTEVTAIELGKLTLTAEELAALQAAFPEAKLSYTLELFGQVLDQDTPSLDLPAMNPGDSEELAAALPLLPNLTEVNFVSEEGVCAYTIEDIPQLDKLRAASPNVHFRVSFELFGQVVTSEDTEIRYVDAEIMNEGLELFYQVLPHLSSCEYLLLDECGVDNERMDQFRDDFPEVKIVWRIWLGRRYTVLTDVTKILASSDSEPKLEGTQTQDLKYCRDVI